MTWVMVQLCANWTAKIFLDEANECISVLSPLEMRRKSKGERGKPWWSLLEALKECEAEPFIKITEDSMFVQIFYPFNEIPAETYLDE